MQKGPGGQGDGGRKGYLISPCPRHAFDLSLAAPACPQGLPRLGAMRLIKPKNWLLSAAAFSDVTKSV